MSFYEISEKILNEAKSSMKNDDLDEYISCIKNESVQDSLKLAALSGVDVKIMIPGKGDQPVRKREMAAATLAK